MIKLSAFSDEVSHDLDTQIKFLQNQKISAMEIRFVDGKNIVTYPLNKVVEFKKVLDNAGIEISAIGSPIGKIRLDESFDQHIELFKHTLDVANALGTTNIRIFSYYAEEGRNIDGCLDIVLERMHRKIALLLGSNLKLIHENEAGIFGHSAQKCAQMASHLDSAYFGLVYDPGNFIWGEKISNPFDRCWPVMKPYVKHIHIKDWTLGNTLGDVPGEGQGQIMELVTELKKMKYDGYLTMEPHLSKGGQFGGETTSEKFETSVKAVRNMADKVQLNLN